ncbi:MAG: GAF domain-containing protein [Planctomycetota bacterium]|jgi:DNA-binding response OmpR family regulator
MQNREAATVLVVDDEPALRELLSDALSGPEMRVRTAASGAEALDLAGRDSPDILITDIRLGDCTGLEVIDKLRSSRSEMPAVVITGYRDTALLVEASRRRPVDVIIKPLDIERLKAAVREELARQAQYRRLRSRARRLRRLARNVNLQRKRAVHQLDTTCAELTAAYRTLTGRMAVQQGVINYQNELLGARNDDDIFSNLFRTFVKRSGSVFGVAMVCDADAELQIIGRFGVPQPDSPEFCRALVAPLAGAMLADPRCTLIEAGEKAELFAEPIRRYLPGLSVLTVPLLPSPGEMIGLVVLYRKGEQPFTDDDMALAELISLPTAVAVRRSE